jgi:hypothetical protein
MTESLVSKAARILRAGNEFSETNQKLKNAVWGFIEWLNTICGNELCYIPIKETGWKIFTQGQNLILYFEYKGKEHEIWKNASIDRYETFCHALAGEEGEKLVRWLEQTAKTRKIHVQTIEQTLERLTPKVDETT